MKKVRIILFVIALVGMLPQILLGYIGQIEKPRLSTDILDRPVHGKELEYITTTSAFFRAINYIDAPGGIVKMDVCQEEAVNQIWQPLGSSLKQVLDTIVKTNPRYKWVNKEGVINLIPASGEPALLRTSIRRFHARNVLTANDALRSLLALPEVKKAMADLNLKPGVSIIVSPQSPNPTSFSVSVKDVTLRETLNAIASAHGREVWEYIEVHCDGRNEVVIRF